MSLQIVQAQDQNIIVYTSFYAKDNLIYSDLYFMYPDGSSKTRVTNFYPYTAREPDFSNDGKHLVFTSNLASFKSANYEDIFRLDLTTSTLTRVTGNEYITAEKTGRVIINAMDDTGLKLSDGEMWVSYQGCDEVITLNELVKRNGLQKVPVGLVWVKLVKNKWIGGLDIVQVTEGETVYADIKYSSGNFLASQPSWSSDGSKIAGVSGYAYYDLDAFYEDGSPKEGKSPYAGFDTIGVWDINGSPLDYLEASPDTLGTNIQPRFSPDGSKLAYCKGPFPYQSIVVVPGDNINGTETVVARGGTDYMTGQSYGYLDPDWSPDGTLIACTYAVYDSNLNLTGNVVLVDSSGSGQVRQITNLPQNAAVAGIDFSPDGQWIAYAVMTSKSSQLNFLDLSLSNFNADIYIQNLATGEQIKITDNGASMEPAWAFAAAQPKINTTIPSNSSTTTIKGGGSTCPFVISLDSRMEIEKLRHVRKIIKNKNEFLVRLYYEHSSEVSLILADSPEIRNSMRDLVKENMKTADDLVKTGKATISDESVRKIKDFLNKIRGEAGINLQDAIDTVLTDIEEGDLLNVLGIEVKIPHIRSE